MVAVITSTTYILFCGKNDNYDLGIVILRNKIFKLAVKKVVC
jgi:hypothetical protein